MSKDNATLFDRVGGTKGIEAIVNLYFEKILAD